MIPVLWFTVLSGVLLAPAANSGAAASRALHAEFQAVLAAERTDLEALATTLDMEGKTAESRTVRALIEPDAGSGPIRFRPLPEYVPKLGRGLANVPVSAASGLPERARTIRETSARSLFKLAGRAAAPGVHRFALADACLRAVLDRDPNHAEARRLIGFLPYKGGWATPHALGLLEKGYVLHPKFDWVLADWAPHLDRGELPGDFSSSGKPVSWLPAEAADAKREEFSRGWQIKTAPHFEIRTNVPLAESIVFGRRLEGFQEMFLSQFADVIGAERLPLAIRFAKPTQKPVAADKKFEVYYFARRPEYVQFLKDQFGLNEDISLGYYMPPSEARRFAKAKPRSYFYRDLENPIAAHSTLYHEASHQILFEMAGKSNVDSLPSNYWIWEGLGTYFETLEAQEDGTLLVGGLVGPRIEQAREKLIVNGEYVPLAKFVEMDKAAFGDPQDVYRNYAQAMALTAFFLNGENRTYREAFLDYVADAYRGKLKTPLSGRLGVPYTTLDAQFKAFLK
ncbi:MAG: hypothetical protein JWN86_3697 [Planctomycetota bacterium]|nr:hypothetical protein [Planctomycetota bacterium]